MRYEADHMPEPAAMAEQLLPDYLSLLEQPALASYGDALQQLERLSVAYALSAFFSMGLRAGQRLRTGELAKQLGVISQHHSLLNRLLNMWADAPANAHQPTLRRLMGGELWQVSDTIGRSDPDALHKRLLDDYPAIEAELALLARCGNKLAEVLRGSCDPLQLLFPQGDLQSATNFYQDAVAAQVINALTQQAVFKIGEHLPRGRGVRILEVGAGTGATTSYLLPYLPSGTEYAFTDISPLFTAKAEQKFGEQAEQSEEFPVMRYQVLDIEKDPVSQGFGAHQFDFVLAANVLHATQDLRQTLQNVHRLLAPGGMLLLLEGTTPQGWMDLIFGMTEGWWRFADSDVRPTHPLLPASAWEALLHETGFKQTASISPESATAHDNIWPADALPQQALIMAQAGEMAQEDATWLILADQGGVAEELAELLYEQGDSAMLAFVGESYQTRSDHTFTINPTNKYEFEQLLAEVDQELAGVIHLWSLDTPHEATSTAVQQAFLQGSGSALHLVQALSKASEPSQLWLVTQGAVSVDAVSGTTQLSQPLSAPLWGMGKVIALEYPDLNCVRVDLEHDVSPSEAARSLLSELNLKRHGDQNEDQVAFRQQRRYVPRLTRLEEASDEPLRLEMMQQGTMNLALQSMTRRQPAYGEVEIRVFATGLNFIDVLDALGMLPFAKTAGLGAECAGEVVAVGEGVESLQIGDAVLGIAKGSFAHYATTDAELMVRMPERLTFEEAATIPINFLTAYIALHELAHISAGDKVLIHAASGGTGMAAVQLAQQAGATVFGTASLPKWSALEELGVQHVYNSRTLDFAAEILADTHQEGVDIVFNSLTAEGFVENSLSVLSPNGRFVEIGKRNIWDATQVAQVKPNVSYFVLDVLSLSEDEPAQIQQVLRELMALFAEGTLQPLPRHVFPLEDAVSAFRLMQQAKHIGKIVVSQPAPPLVPPNIRGEKEQARAESRVFTCHADGSYLITGGLGGLGLLVAKLLLERGAGQVVLVSRSQPKEAIKPQLKALEEMGATIIVAQADVSQREQLAGVLNGIDPAYPLRGVIHAAGVLDDGVLSQQTVERFRTVFAPKVDGAWHLHTLTTEIALDFFVLFSSAASLLGSSGQANHAGANAFLDALAYHRREQGLAGLSINWGAWSDIGSAAKKVSGLKEKGMGAIPPEQGLEILQWLLTQSATQVGVVPIDWAEWAPQFMKEQRGNSKFWAELPYWGELSIESPNVSESEPLKLEFRDQLESATDRRAFLTAHVRQQVAHVLGWSASDASISLEKGFFELGMDSLTSMELRNRLQSTLACSLSSTLTFDYPNIAALVDHLLHDVFTTSSEPAPTESSFPEELDAQTAWEEEEEDDMDAFFNEMDEISDHDIEKMWNLSS